MSKKDMKQIPILTNKQIFLSGIPKHKLVFCKAFTSNLHRKCKQTQCSAVQCSAVQDCSLHVVCTQNFSLVPLQNIFPAL